MPDEIFVFERIYHSALLRVEPELAANHTEFYPNNLYFYPPLYFNINSYLLEYVFLKNGVSPLVESFQRYGHLFRIENLLLSIFILFLSFKIVRKVGLNNYLSQATFLFFSLLPTSVAFSVALNSQVHFFLFISIFIYLLLKEQMSNKMLILLGVITGLSMLIRFEGILLVFFLIPYVLKNKELSKRILHLLVFLISAAGICGWWYGYNLIRFHNVYNPNLFKATAQYYVKPFTFDNYFQTLIRDTKETFVFTVGRFNNVRFPSSGYLVWNLIFLLGSLGWYLYLKDKFHFNKRASIFLKAFLLFFIANLAFFLQINLTLAYQAQGRFLYPSLIFISFFIVLGISRFFARRMIRYYPILFLVVLLIYNYWGFACVAREYHKIFLVPDTMACINYLR